LNASKQPEDKERIAFRMGAQTKLQKKVQGFKSKLIKAAGGYGGFIKKYKRDPFSCTEAQAQKLVGRNSRCFCGSGRKVKKCCLIK
jgi:uncharacterized protein YecA (UPF0149 family)